MIYVSFFIFVFCYSYVWNLGLQFKTRNLWNAAWNIHFTDYLVLKSRPPYMRNIGLVTNQNNVKYEIFISHSGLRSWIPFHRLSCFYKRSTLWNGYFIQSKAYISYVRAGWTFACKEYEQKQQQKNDQHIFLDWMVCLSLLFAIIIASVRPLLCQWPKLSWAALLKVNMRGLSKMQRLGHLHPRLIRLFQRPYWVKQLFLECDWTAGQTCLLDKLNIHIVWRIISNIS